MSESKPVSLSGRIAGNGLFVGIAMGAATLAVAAAVLWSRPATDRMLATGSAQTTGPIGAAAALLVNSKSTRQDPVIYPTQRENGLPAHDHGR